MYSVWTVCTLWFYCTWYRISIEIWIIHNVYFYLQHLFILGLKRETPKNINLTKNQILKFTFIRSHCLTSLSIDQSRSRNGHTFRNVRRFDELPTRNWQNITQTHIFIVIYRTCYLNTIWWELSKRDTQFSQHIFPFPESPVLVGDRTQNGYTPSWFEEIRGCYQFLSGWKASRLLEPNIHKDRQTLCVQTLP